MFLQVGHLLSLHPRIVRYFFQGKLCMKAVSRHHSTSIAHMFSMHGNDALLAHADHPQHISTWFQSSYVRSISEFNNGAKALAQYALLHRAEVGI